MTTTYLSATTVFNPQAFVIPLTRTEPSSLYHFGYSIYEIDYYVVSGIVNLSILVGTKAATSVQLNLYATNAHQIKALKINYAVIEPIFQVYTFSYHWMNPNRVLTNGQFYEETTTGHGPFNSAGLVIWSTLAGVDATLTNN